MKVSENVDLSPLSYMKIGGKARYFIEIEKEEELQKIVEIKESEKIPIVILGEGSNTVFDDEPSGNLHDKVFVKIVTDEIIKTYEDSNGANISVSAGVNWDDLVAWTVKQKLSGLELLSAIPGSVGAAPVQNIGAYGAEVSETLTHLKVFDLETADFYELSNEDCRFSYRDSILKQNPGRFIVTEVSFRLSKEKPELPKYKDIALYFLKEKNKEPTLNQIRKAVVEIRTNKLPNPETDPNCGSFFKNPIIENTQAETLAKKFPKMPQFKVSEEEIKISAGWLIEEVGLKGRVCGGKKVKTKNKKKYDFVGNVRTSNTNALVLIADAGATFRELENARDEIIRSVEKNFGIHLEVEPNLIA